jgi:site-specific DNA recombinase
MPATVRYPERPVSTQQVNKMLRNRYYTGVVRFDHVHYPGRHEALVDGMTFETVQDLLTSRRVSKDKPQKRPHPLKGSIYCGRCGRRFGIVHAKGQAGGTYPYFYCLGRQQDPSGCVQMYVGVDRVENAVIDHLANYRLDESRRAAVREAVLDHFRTRIEESQHEVTAQQGRMVKLNRQRQKAKDAYFADAMDIDDFKTEQQRISRELTAAEAIIQRNLTSLTDIERGVDQALSLLINPAGFYLAAPDSVKHMLLQAMFERIWLIDDVVVGADLTRPYAELLGVEATLDARNALSGTDDAFMTYERREAVGLASTDLRSYLRVERPQGLLAIDMENSWPNAEAVGSNFVPLVGLTGFEPAASSSRTTRATKLRHSPRKRSESTRARAVSRTGSDGRPRGERDQRRVRAAAEANGGRRRGSETGRDVHPRRGMVVGLVLVKAFGTSGVEVAVGHQRTNDRQAQLSAVRVPGEDHRVTVAVERVKHPEVRGVRYRDREVGL